MTTLACEPGTILVYVGLDLIGDALMKMPFVVALRETYPRAHITWLAGKGRTVFLRELAPLVEGRIDEVIEEAGIGSHWQELLSRPLANRRFDLIIDTQRRLLTTLILRRIPAGLFVSGAAGFALSGIRPPAGYRRPATMVRQILDLIELASGRKVDERFLELHDAASGTLARRLLPEGHAYVGFVPGSSAGRANKRWPLDRYVELARRQALRGRIPVFVLGPEEASWHDGIACDVSPARFPLQEASAAGERTGPLLTIALAGRMRAAVSNDSGGGHLVAAGGVPLVSLWGPSVMEKAPPQTRRLVTILARDLGSTAMEAIPVDTVDAALEGLLAQT